MRSRDTSTAARQILAEIEDRLTDGDRLRILDQEYRDAKAILRAGLRAQFPDESPDRIEARAFRSLLGDDLGARAWAERMRRTASDRD
jgi:hypothetical protein